MYSGADLERKPRMDLGGAARDMHWFNSFQFHAVFGKKWPK